MSLPNPVPLTDNLKDLEMEQRAWQGVNRPVAQNPEVAVDRNQAHFEAREGARFERKFVDDNSRQVEKPWESVPKDVRGPPPRTLEDDKLDAEKTEKAEAEEVGTSQNAISSNTLRILMYVSLGVGIVCLLRVIMLRYQRKDKYSKAFLIGALLFCSTAIGIGIYMSIFRSDQQESAIAKAVQRKYKKKQASKKLQPPQAKVRTEHTAAMQPFEIEKKETFKSKPSDTMMRPPSHMSTEDFEEYMRRLGGQAPDQTHKAHPYMPFAADWLKVRGEIDDSNKYFGIADQPDLAQRKYAYRDPRMQMGGAKLMHLKDPPPGAPSPKSAVHPWLEKEQVGPTMLLGGDKDEKLRVGDMSEIINKRMHETKDLEGLAPQLNPNFMEPVKTSNREGQSQVAEQVPQMQQNFNSQEYGPIRQQNENLKSYNIPLFEQAFQEKDFPSESELNEQIANSRKA